MRLSDLKKLQLDAESTKSLNLAGRPTKHPSLANLQARGRFDQALSRHLELLFEVALAAKELAEKALDDEAQFTNLKAKLSLLEELDG